MFANLDWLARGDVSGMFVYIFVEWNVSRVRLWQASDLRVQI
jgi:hypothetical protein